MIIIKEETVDKLKKLKQKLNHEVKEDNLLSEEILKISQELDEEIVKIMRDKANNKI